ncbi:MAG TPA: alpha/beta hydrolase [Acidimicrobiia bacterium]|nr:alpha/beta hydrolase [Acidimicrobiia bacterium]
MPTAPVNGVEINYEVVGRRGPWVAILQGGRHSLLSVWSHAQALAAHGYRVLLHDPRNSGGSSLDFDSPESEEDVGAADLDALLRHLDAPPAILIGQSRGARVALRVALRYLHAVRGLVFWGLSGGPLATRYLDNMYYLQYVRAAQGGGMSAVCDLEHFRTLLKTRPDQRQVLLEQDPAQFVEAMVRWREAFLVDSDAPVMGVSDDDLRRIDVPTAIAPLFDRLHPYAVAVHAHGLIRESCFVDSEPARRVDEHTSPPGSTREVGRVAEILRDHQARVAHRSSLRRLGAKLIGPVRRADGRIWAILRGPIDAFHRWEASR